jgi:glyoxylase-like metal-dependent hydrolase (beta-lactamase superfamily II)
LATTSAEPLKQIADDIYQVRLPLPFALNHVNCYLLREDQGWTILDTGLNIPEARTVWQTVLADLQIGAADIRRIILSHVHPDHYGLAGWLQEWSGAPVLMSPREAELARQLWQENNLGQTMFRLFRQAGVPEAIEGEAIAHAEQVRQLTFPHPRRVELIEPGAVLSTGRRQLKAFHAPGHSDGQLVFYDAADQLLLSGDQVLLKITPNIGLWPVSEPDPLGRYLTSLQQLSQLEVRLALPGHRDVIINWFERLAELEQHHAARLEAMLAAVEAGNATAYQVCNRVFNTQEFTMHELRFAVAETLAHLEYLVKQERLRREDNGVWLYRL